MIRKLAVAGGIMLVCLGLLVVGLALLPEKDPEASDIQVSEYHLPDATTEALRTPVPTREPPVEPTLVPAPAEIVSVQIPSLHIDAPIVVLGLLPGGVMESPAGPEEVGWYSFSARPGVVGNAVFAGHVDYAGYGPAVFWDLREIEMGAVIELLSMDGSTLVYRVISLDVYKVNEAPVQAIVGPTSNESITLITCTGVFDRTLRDYDQRLVIRAERVGSDSM